MTPSNASIPPMRIMKWSSKPADHNTTRVRNNQRRHRARVKFHIEDLEKRLEESNSKLETALQKVASLTAEVEFLRRGALDMRNALTTPMPTRCDQSAGYNPSVDSPRTSLDSATTFDHLPEAPQRSNGGKTADCDCQSLPAPAPGESTVPCSSAFQIIEQQNYSGVEVTTISAWLAPSFRKAFRPGESCRVESNRLYELLDRISCTTPT